MTSKIITAILCLAVILTTMLAPGAAPVKVALAQSHIGVNVTPQQTTVGFNESFNVTIWIDDSLGESYDGVAIRLVYNTSYVTATGVTDAGTFDFVLDPGTINNTWNATHGLITYDAISLMAGPLNTSNPVCTVNFTSNSSNTGISGLNFIYIPADAATSVTSGGADILNWTYVVNGTVRAGIPALTVNVTPSGGGNVTVNGTTPPSYPNTTTWNYGDNVTLNATPAGGYSFVNWTGDLSGSTNPTNITMSGNYSITANFAAAAVSIGLNVTPQHTTVGLNENFTVTIYIDDSVGQSYDGVAIRLVYNTSYVTATNVIDAGTFDFVLDPGTINNTWNATHGLVKYDAISLMAGPLNISNPVITVNFTSNSSNSGISGLDFIYIPADAATSITSGGADILNWTYVVNGTVEVGSAQYNLTITSTAGGSVTTPGEGTFTYNASEVVALVAAADTNYSFVNWTGNVGTIANVNSATTNITMSGTYSITANFAAVVPVQYNLTIASTAGGSVTTPGEGTFTYNASEVVALVAVAATNYSFVNWTGNVGTIADVNSATTNITMSGNYSITANFAAAAVSIGLNVTPQHTTVGLNENFTVTICIDDAVGQSYDGVAIRLVYNTSYVTATSVTDAGTFDFVLDPGTFNNTWNATHGLVKYDAISLMAGPLNISNPVCTINFTSNSSNSGISGLDFIYIASDAATSITSGGADILNWTYVVNGTVTVVSAQYNLTITSTVGGSVTTPGEGTFIYNVSQVVALVAAADTGYSFVNWTGNVGTIANVNSATTNITMSGNYSITANFAAAAVSIGLNVTPQHTTVGLNENFTVTICIDDAVGQSYDGVAIRLVYNTSYVTATGVTDAGTFDFVLDPGTINNTWNATHGLVKYDAISLMAGPLNISNPVITVNFTSNSSNSGISGLDFIYIPADAATCITLGGSDILNWTYVVNGTVTVVSAQYNLTITSTAGGSVTTPGEGTFTYNASAVVALVAAADTGYSFVNWTGDVGTIANVNSATTNITMSGNYSITANFAAGQYNLTINSTVGGSVTTPGEGTFGLYGHGEVVALVAVADIGYSFVNWTGDVGTIADVNSATTNITMSGNYSITANFAAAIPDISVSPTEKNFGNITVGSSLPQTFTVSNVGYADLVVGALTITGTNADQFTIQNDNVSNQTIIAGGSATLQVVFSPTSTGAKSATLNIPSNDPDEATVLVPLNGTGVTGEPDISVSPTEKNFGSITVGSSSSPQTFNVSNVGDADLVVWTINITGTHANQFTIHNDNVSNQTIIANGSATLQVVFSPTSTGAKSATLNIPSNDPAEATVSVPLNGTGITGGGGGGGGGGPAAYYLTVNMLGDISKWNISEQGNLLEPLQVSSADNKVTIALGKAASCLDKEDNRLNTITISRQSGWPSLPEDYSIIGTAYAFRPAGAKFAPSLSLTLGYADNDVPQYVSEEDLYIAYYDATAESWVPLTSQVNTQNNRISAPVRHFTTFAIMGVAVPPTPAEFSVTSLDLSSEQVEPGQEVLVTVNVTNIGGSEGSYTLDLTINGEVEQTKTVTLAALASDTVTFVVIKEELGTYTVSIDGLTKEFIVGAPSWVSQYWWIVLAAIVIIGVVVSFLWARRRRAPQT